MKLLPTLHPAGIMRGKWDALSWLGRDLQRASKEAWTSEIRRQPVEYIEYSTVEQARRFLQIGDRRPLTLDIETVGEDIVCTGVTRDARQACCMPHRAPFTDMLAAALRDPSSVKVAQNLPFDFPRLEKDLGILIAGPWRDTLAMHALVEPDLEHRLARLGSVYYDGEPWKAVKQQLTLEHYNCIDVDVTARAHNSLLDEITALGLEEVHEKSTSPILPVFLNIHKTGVRIDLEEMERISGNFTARAQALVEEFRKAAVGLGSRQARASEYRRQADALEEEAEPLDKPGTKREAGKLRTKARKLREAAQGVEEINLGSTKQVAELFFGDCELLAPKRRGPAGVRDTHDSTADVVLAELERVCQSPSATRKQKFAAPMLTTLRSYREVSKLVGTYLNYESEIVNPMLLAWGTGTGRPSCKEPNLQNIPTRTELGRQIRRIFKPTEPGWEFTEVDYSQIERRIQAWHAPDEELIAAFAAGEDVHKLTASKIFNCRFEDVTKEQRYFAKRSVYGESYGMGYLKFQRELLKEGTFVTPQKAKEMLAALAHAHPKIAAWKERQVAKAEQHRMLRTPFGRIRWFLAPSPYGNAINFIPQGTTADVILRAMVRLSKELPSPAQMVMQVHDSVLMQHPVGLRTEVRRKAKEVMEAKVEEMQGWWCPTEAKSGASWAEIE